MRLTPRSEADARAAEKPNLLRDGFYPARVESAFETESKRGSPMIEVSLAVRRPDNTEWIFSDYLTDAPIAALRLRHLAHAVGASASYDAGEISPDDLSGRDVRVKVGTEKKRGFRPRNVILDYEPPAAPAVVPLRQAG